MEELSSKPKTAYECGMEFWDGQITGLRMKLATVDHNDIFDRVSIREEIETAELKRKYLHIRHRLGLLK